MLESGKGGVGGDGSWEEEGAKRYESTSLGGCGCSVFRVSAHLGC